MSQYYKNVTGWIYVIETETACKIGYSENPRRRIAQIQTMCPDEFKRVFISCCSPDVMRIEKNLHRQFAKYKTKGEWFRTDYEKIVYEVKKATGQYKQYFPDKLKESSERLGNILNVKGGQT